MSRESVRLDFLAAALNELDILVADIQNAYFKAPTKENIYIIHVSEFGSNKDRPDLIVKALYGLKSSGTMLRDNMVVSLRDIVFKIYLTDPTVWIRPGTKPEGFEY